MPDLGMKIPVACLHCLGLLPCRSESFITYLTGSPMMHHTSMTIAGVTPSESGALLLPLEGNVLDLLLTNCPTSITNINILDKDKVCKSDHFGIVFSIKMSTKRIKSVKRKMFNFKKANWDALNSDLNRVQWDRCLKFCDAQTAWARFKDILHRFCDKHIPKITIKSQFQPPWFDSDMHKLCKKKERLRARYKPTKSDSDLNKFKESRKYFKKAYQNKMKSNFDDDADPAIISKRFWNHVKSSSNSTRIPDTISYAGKYRNNVADQAELFNVFFHNQFSSPSSYNIDINFKNDPFSDFSISWGDVLK